MRVAGRRQMSVVRERRSCPSGCDALQYLSNRSSSITCIVVVHTSAYVSIRQHTTPCGISPADPPASPIHTVSRQHTSACVSIRQHTYAATRCSISLQRSPASPAHSGATAYWPPSGPYSPEFASCCLEFVSYCPPSDSGSSPPPPTAAPTREKARIRSQ